MQRGGRGVEWKFNTATVARWREQKAVADATGDGPIEEAELKRRKLLAETLTVELELAKARGEVAPIREFERATASLMAAIRQNVLNVPQRIVVRLIGCTDEAEFKRELRAELTLALTEAANAEPELDENADGDDD